MPSVKDQWNRRTLGKTQVGRTDLKEGEKNFARPKRLLGNPIRHNCLRDCELFPSTKTLPSTSRQACFSQKANSTFFQGDEKPYCVVNPTNRPIFPPINLTQPTAMT